ncbi:MAG: glycosyltransferase family 2 protein [Candidatus Falkowbacteria bacterium]
MKKLSIILPVYNEEGNLVKLFSELSAVAEKILSEYEIIAVNDGSKDGSLKVLADLARKNQHIKVVDFTKNFGQTAAISAGIDLAEGDILVLIDSDLENDPNDMPVLIRMIEEGYDVVSGWRKGRWRGNLFTRKLPSVTANQIISSLSGVKLHDYGCTLKAYRASLVKNIRFYGEMHRFIPIFISWNGGKVGEIAVNYRAREYGRSKYGLFRTFSVILDLLLIKFLEKYMTRPIHFFGGLGFVSFFLGLLSAAAAVILKVTGLRSFVATPLPVFSALLLIVGIQLIALGVVSEILMRTYYESQNKPAYSIKGRINLS